LLPGLILVLLPDVVASCGWTPIAAVTLNPERDAVVKAALDIGSIEKKAA